MPFAKVRSEKLAEAVVRQIEDLILQGLLHPGERLPSERELSERMGVSRPSLREGVSELHERGLLESRPGAGMYVSESLAAEFPPALTRLFATHDQGTQDYIAFRRDMEGLAVARAAKRGTETDLKVVDRVFREMEDAHSKGDATLEAALDAEFHMAIVDACHNAVMLHVMRALYGLLQKGVLYNRRIMFQQRTTRETLLDQHRAINTALQLRDADAARAAVFVHLDYVQHALDAQRREDEAEAIAQQRLARRFGA
ncbi:MAG: FCD domain-containing protein [Pseudomonadota bacterium]